MKRPHRPLLFIAGEKDNIVPADLNRKNYAAYKDPGSIRDFKVFEGRGHFTCGAPGWEDVAAYVATWLKNVTN
jgi:pimeloyl-ACP methyl ester carboxylesterase